MSPQSSYPPHFFLKLILLVSILAFTQSRTLSFYETEHLIPIKSHNPEWGNMRGDPLDNPWTLMENRKKKAVSLISRYYPIISRHYPFLFRPESDEIQEQQAFEPKNTSNIVSRRPLRLRWG